MKKTIVFTAFLSFLITNGFLYSQNRYNLVFDEKESLTNFPEGIYKDEMMLFAYCGDSACISNQQSDYFEESVVWKLDDGVALFSINCAAYCYEPLRIEIDGTADSSFVKDVFFTFNKEYCHLPDSAICDIVNPVFSHYFIRNPESIEDYLHRCGFRWHFSRKKSPKPIIENWHVYVPKQVSIKQKPYMPLRFYLHMINYKYNYEVIWIIDQDKYIGRVVNKLE